MSGKCYCCGRAFPSVDARMDGGPVHLGCWDEHHSDPTGPWPPEHVCAMDEMGGAR